MSTITTLFPWHAEEPLVLDTAIMYWVLFPICIVMFLQGLLRQYVAVLLKDDKPSPLLVPTPLSIAQAQEQLTALQHNSVIARSRRLRYNGNFLAQATVAARKKFFVTKALTAAAVAAASNSMNNGSDGDDTAAAAAAPAQDPTAMLGALKQNMSMMIPNMLLMAWITYFFSGFVIVQLPFTVAERLKQMLQRGIALSHLNSSYVSSISWYFLNLFGLRGLFTLVLGDGSAAVDNPDMAMMQQQQQMAMSGGGAPGAQAIDYGKLFEQEKSELDITSHEFKTAEAEERLLMAARQ